MKGEPFGEVDILRTYPRESVPDHIILMSFNGDDQAAAFAEWWGCVGSFRFNAWLANQKKVADE